MIKEKTSMLKHPVFLSLVIFIIFGQAAFGANMHFSTGGANTISWTITKTSGVAVLSFENNEIDASDPTPDTVLNDLIDLPDMTLTNQVVTNIGGVDFVTVDLVPIDPTLQIRADVAVGSVAADDIVMSADLIADGLLTVGANYIAYSSVQDDLNNVTHVAGYSNVIDVIAAADVGGYDVDLSFSGDSAAALSDLLAGTADGSVSGTLSGQINAVPEPGMIAMLSLVAVVFLLRRKHRV